MGVVLGFQWQHVTHGRIQLLREDAAQAGAFHFIVELGIERIDIHG